MQSVKILTSEELKNTWKKICDCYDATRESNRPELTIQKIIGEVGLNEALQAFAVVAKIKDHDGRINSYNRDFLSPYLMNKDAAKWESSNPMTYAGLDHIHTTHIDQMISSLAFEVKKGA